MLESFFRVVFRIYEQRLLVVYSSLESVSFYPCYPTLHFSFGHCSMWNNSPMVVNPFWSVGQLVIIICEAILENIIAEIPFLLFFFILKFNLWNLRMASTKRGALAVGGDGGAGKLIRKF